MSLVASTCAVDCLVKLVSEVTESKICIFSVHVPREFRCLCIGIRKYY